MSNKIEFSRLLVKRVTLTGETATVNTASTIDNTWLNTDILAGELLMNTVDDRVFTRTANGIFEFSLSPSGTSTNDFCTLGLKTRDLSGCTNNSLSIASSNAIISGGINNAVIIASTGFTASKPATLYTDNLNVAFGLTASTYADVNIISGQGLSFNTGNTEVRQELLIGDWDMTATTSVAIAHNLSGTEWKTIRSTGIIIRNDADDTYYDGSILTGVQTNDVGIAEFDSTNITVFRAAGGFFASADFDATSYNRGFVSFWYQPD